MSDTANGDAHALAILDLTARLTAMRETAEHTADELRTTTANLAGALGRLDRLERTVTTLAVLVARPTPSPSTA